MKRTCQRSAFFLLQPIVLSLFAATSLITTGATVATPKTSTTCTFQNIASVDRAVDDVATVTSHTVAVQTLPASSKTPTFTAAAATADNAASAACAAASTCSFYSSLLFVLLIPMMRQGTC